MSYNLIINDKKYESLFSFYREKGLVYNELKDIQPLSLSKSINQNEFDCQKFGTISEELLKKLEKNNITTYGDIANIGIDELKNNYSREEILSIFSQTLPLLDKFLDDIYLRGIICEASLSYMRNNVIGKLLYDILIKHITSFKDLGVGVDKNATLFVYLEYFHFFERFNFYFHERNIKLFPSLYDSLSSEDKERLKPLLSITECLEEGRVVYFDEFAKIFKITHDDIVEFEDYIQEGKRELGGERKIKIDCNGTEVQKRKLNDQMLRIINFVFSLFDNKLISADDLKFMLGEDSEEYIQYKHYLIMKNNLKVNR